jgi:two-component system chemotaxis response regulator CheB
MPGHDIIVVGASAGGVEALVNLVKALPPDLPAAVFVVLHLPAHSPSALPLILGRKARLRVAQAEDDAPVQHGRIYVASPDSHLLLKGNRVSLSHGPRENAHRPAIDTLFRSAALIYGPRVVGVILSGTLDDGTAGLLAIKRRGGKALVQDPEEALYDGMPRSALDLVPVDFVAPVAALALELIQLAHAPVLPAPPPPRDMELEAQIAEFDMDSVESGERNGEVSVFTCPECHGTLWEIQDGELIRYRCRVGHGFSGDSLLAEQSAALDEALWTAFRALEESAALARRLSERMQTRGYELPAQRFEEQARDAERRAALVRQVLLRGELSVPADSLATAPPPPPVQSEENG